MSETSEERENRLRQMDNGTARSLAIDVGNAAFDVLEDIDGPNFWLGNHDQDVTITLSVADWARVFTALQYTAALEGQQGQNKAALDYAYLSMSLAAEMAAVVAPLPAA